ncbi:hypothetical protein P8609_14980 [Lysobacter sp. UC]|uniref:Uncharacterized protein n=1 Tax=Lysobacter arvi TaxID=3038776 RepID=A0ABU1CH35_9GAMM|nr:hypothetical protein [Lysobacter arvi]
MLTTLGGAAAVVVVLAFSANSVVSGLGYLLMVFIAWLAFAAVMSLGGLATLIVLFILEIPLLPVGNDVIKRKVLWRGSVRARTCAPRTASTNAWSATASR